MNKTFFKICIHTYIYIWWEKVWKVNPNNVKEATWRWGGLQLIHIFIFAYLYYKMQIKISENFLWWTYLYRIFQIHFSYLVHLFLMQFISCLRGYFSNLLTRFHCLSISRSVDIIISCLAPWASTFYSFILPLC